MEILYSDKNIIVCVKPVGLDSEKQVPDQLKEMFEGEIFPLHRLDLNVGGVMVYARNKKIADEVKTGDILAYIHANDEQKGKEAAEQLKNT